MLQNGLDIGIGGKIPYRGTHKPCLIAKKHFHDNLFDAVWSLRRRGREVAFGTRLSKEVYLNDNLVGAALFIHLRHVLLRWKASDHRLQQKHRTSGLLKEHSMKKLILTVAAAALFLSLSAGYCRADEEPKWEFCGKLDDWSKVRECQDQVVAWWDKRLNAAYQKQKKQCSTTECSKKLQEAEQAWIRYKDLMVQAAYEAAGGHEAKQTAIEAGEKVRCQLTKQQALLLEHLSTE